MAESRASVRRGRRVGAAGRAAGALACLVIVVSVAAGGCGSSAQSRLRAGDVSSTTKGGDVVVDPGTVPIVPAKPTTTSGAAPTSKVQLSPRQTAACNGTAKDFVPGQIPGYNLAASTDVSNALGANDPTAKYVDSLGGIVATRSDGKGGLVVVAKFNAAGSDFVKTSTDTVFMFLMGAKAVQKVNVDGLAVYTGTSAESKTVYALQYCENVFMVVTASDPQIALDVLHKVIATSPRS